MRRSMKMKKSLLIMAISFVPLVSGLYWGTPRVAAEVVRGGKTVVVESDSPKCLPNAPTYIGIYMDDLSDSIKEEYQYPHEGGVLITGVAGGSPAEKAGLEGHDVVYRFGKEDVENSLHLCSLVQGRKPGDKVTLVIYRDDLVIGGGIVERGWKGDPG